MNKKGLFFLTAIGLSVLVNSMCFSQEKFYGIMPMEEGRVNYTLIVQADSLTKETLHSKIKDWAVNSYGSQKATLQAEDKEAGYIAYKGYLPAVAYGVGGVIKSKPYNVHLYHTLKFYIKDNKYKIVFDDLYAYNTLTEQLFGIAEKTPLEKWGQDKKGKVPTKWIDGYTRDIASFDKSINNLLGSINKSVLSGKSAFDF